ncbi:mannosyltransferase putative-domain-containing protein [Cokeromyces recurvatus]|uniref:mannosyltransferase putative-domain-containing protein n=1 Tax=Cokeromyces recurvatus TaxID=90255 RepID=UPI00221F8D2A|nr:mannosyltransferase putative-domain-containing protein [Cokeromyces recurvatus]KAI7905705.1 mannosyltransferase putative-domain-containing protein [Cokeromyces recurvatus]
MQTNRVRIIRLLFIVLAIFCFFFLFHYLLDIQQQNAIQKERELEEARIALQKEKEQEEKLLMELKRERLQRILDNRSVLEPKLTLDDTVNQELLDKYYIAVPSTLEPWTEDTLQFLKSPIGQNIKSDLLTIPEIIPNFKTLTTQERTFKALFEYLDPLIAEDGIDVVSERYKETWQLYNRLEQILFPWIRPYWKNVFEMNKPSNRNSRGIVMCVSDDHLRHARVSIPAIRNILKSDMPIELFYIDESDLSKENRAFFESFPNVTTINISKRINNKYTQFNGWEIKPYAILASSFEEVLIMDADVFMFKKPETFFEDKGYEATGALFFFDRTLFNDFQQGRIWLRSFLPTYSSFVEQSRWWKTTSAHEQESGIVVINKRKALFGLLATCKMNDKNERDHVSYQHVHGDKETFWIGFEMIQSPYAFVKSVGAVIGGLGDAGAEGTVCGNLLHLDTENQPWWWNGGVFRNKNKWENRYLKFTHFAQGEDWQFETSCIKNKDKIQELNSKEREYGKQLIELDKKNNRT